MCCSVLDFWEIAILNVTIASRLRTTFSKQVWVFNAVSCWHHIVRCNKHYYEVNALGATTLLLLANSISVLTPWHSTPATFPTLHSHTEKTHPLPLLPWEVYLSGSVWTQFCPILSSSLDLLVPTATALEPSLSLSSQTYLFSVLSSQSRKLRDTHNFTSAWFYWNIVINLCCW